MYNEEVKRKFPQFNENGYISRFNKSEKYERLLNKDIGEMSHEEYLNYMKGRKFNNIGTLIAQDSNYKQYREWYSKEINRRNINIRNLSDDEKKACLKQENGNFFISRKALMKKINGLRNYCDKVIILSYTEGLMGRGDYTTLYEKEIDSVVLRDGKYYFISGIEEHKITNELAKNMMESAKCMINYCGKKNEEFYGPYIIKDTKNKQERSEKNFAKMIYQRTQRIIEELDLTDKDISMSAKIEYIYNLCNKNNIDIYGFFEREDLKKEFNHIFRNYNIMKNKVKIVNNYKSVYLDEGCIIYKKFASEEEQVKFFARKGVDYVKVTKENIKIGKAGEEFIYNMELHRVKEKFGSSKKVIWKSRDEGDGLGYDILSYDENGEEIYIEVKTTDNKENTAFYVTNTELEFSKKMGDKYRLYRVYDFDKKQCKGKVSIQIGSLEEICNNPILYKVQSKSD